MEKVLVEYLYLDLNTCDRCVGADKVLDEVLMVITPAFQMAGFFIELKKVEIETAKMAQEHRFLSSPTIRVNGQDICSAVAENACGCCSDISGTDVNCRVFEYKGKTYEVPPHEMLAQAVMNAVFGKLCEDCFCDEYMLPENLKAFFEGKADKSSCSCGGNCC
ncbi:MAG TPA: ferredoxin [Lachnospiraceae bacterium]|nr:ferredoxin [Lachnospiraceae bacterium]